MGHGAIRHFACMQKMHGKPLSFWKVHGARGNKTFCMYAENVWKTPIILESAWYLSKYSYIPYYSYPHLYYISMYGYYVYLPLQTYYFYPHLYNISTTSSLVKKFFTLLLYVCLIDVVTE